jgi:hypothetical protein
MSWYTVVAAAAVREGCELTSPLVDGVRSAVHRPMNPSRTQDPTLDQNCPCTAS